MKRSILFFVSICLLLSYVMAEPVDSLRALQVAAQFVPQSSLSKKAPKKGAATPVGNIVYTHKMPKSGRDAFYVVNVGDAFVLVSADDVAHQILGYSFDKGFPVAADGTVQLPPHVKGFFDDLAAQMEAAIDAEPNRASDDDWTGARKAVPRRAPSNLPESVDPLLTTTWDQGQYYNALCPEDVNGLDGHVVTGCVATAMAQIIKFWGEPVHGRGIHSYESNYGNLEVNFAESNYDFNNMPDALTDESTAEQVNAVAKLMYDCGVAVNMGYAAGESSAFDQEARAGLINYFYFSPDLSFAEKAYFSNEEWNNLLRQNLAANQPVYYSSQGTGGHAFVCDGYKADDYYHFNFGWGGFADGWFQTSAVTPSDREYNSSQSAIVGIVPNNTGNVILGQMQGASTFIVDEPLEFCHLMGHNKYEGSNYNNSCNSTATFISVDASKQMVADIMEFEDQNIQIYDGTNTNNSLRSLYGGEVNDLSPVVSSVNAITITYSGNLYDAGFKMVISQDNGYRMVSNIVTSVKATTAHLVWKENGTAPQWQIEYGFKDFELGEGTVYNTTTNTATFENLEKFTEYDFYIRSDYGNKQYGPWNKVTLMTEAPYWIDVITTRPEGYDEDDMGNIAISSAEGLAWFARKTLNNDYNNKHVIITSDINMSQYMWKPMRLENGSFNGNGHTIDSVFVIEHNVIYSSIGFWGDVVNSTIENVILNNVYVLYSFTGNSGYNCVGGLAGAVSAYSGSHSSVVNCLVNGKIKGGKAGGLVGWISNASIINSASLCDISSNSAGGIVAMSDLNSAIRNCYMGGSITPTVHGTWCGAIIANAFGGIIKDCYYRKDAIDRNYMWGGAIPYSEHLDSCNIVSFEYENSSWVLDRYIDFDDISYNNLVDVLNKGVEFVNISGLKTWQNDDANINNGLPVFGEEYFVSCPNVSNLCLRNIVQDDNHGVVVCWEENGSAERWQIRYKLQDSSEYSIYATSHNPDTLWNLAFGENYKFSVRPMCDKTHHGAWTDDIVFAVNTPYWTETVVSQPTGYTVDSDGNVTISTSEGLAWLISVINGLNGQEPNSLDDKQVILASDVDMSNLRWVSINGFCGQFDGDNHVISGINIDEQSNNQGLFGKVENANIVNVNMQDVTVSALENVGGLCGCSQGSSFDNCSVSGIINGRAHVGGLVGEMDDSSIQHSSTQGSVIASLNEVGGLVGTVKLAYEISLSVNCYVGNCRSSCDVRGASNCTGGLIGCVYAYSGDIMIENSYSKNAISGFTYVGGLIGAATGFYSNIVTIRNCCSYSNVEAHPLIVNSVYPDEWLNGAFVGQCIGSVRLSRCYMMPNGDLQFIGSHHGTFDDFSMSDISFFDMIDNDAILKNPVVINSISYNHVEEALNAWVGLYADDEYFTWVPDTSEEYKGKPIFGDLYNESCPAVVNIQADSIWNDGVRLSWNDNESVSLWKVEYGESGFEKDYGTTLYVSNNNVDIYSLKTGSYYDFYVQAVCDNNKLGKCDSKITVKPDKEYWKDIVTSRPDGYVEDVDGNIYISTAEGLAWLISVSNGLNGQAGNSFNNRTICLTRDVDISDYRWTAIQSLEGVFDGMNHTITGLYINENDDSHAMFSSMSEGSCIKNIIIRDGIIKGRNNVAGICVLMQGLVQNCAIDCSVRSNNYAGIVTAYNYGNIINSYVKGNIIGNEFVGGAVGWNFGYIYNCYSTSVLESCMLSHGDVSSSRLGQFSGIDQIQNDCNIAFWLNSPYNINNSIHATGDSDIGYYSFSGSDTIWLLNDPQIIAGTSYTDLISALNAWVDANNSEGQYRHWVKDTENVNGGFPIFAPAYMLTYKIDDEIYKTQMVEPGAVLPAIAEPTKEGYSFGGWSELPEAMPDHDVEVRGMFYLYGDVNTDMKVNVVDVVDIARYVVDTPSEHFREKVADLNSDLSVNIADAVVLVNHIAGDQYFTKAAIPMGTLYGHEPCDLRLIAGEDNGLSLTLTGNMDFTAFQFEVDVPEGIDISAMRINSQRKDGHQLLFNKVADKRYRVAALSLSNAVFKGNDGELLNISLEGTGAEDICVHDIHFVTTNGTDVVFDNLYINGNTTGIDDIHANENAPIYDLQGRRRSALQRGTNIVGNRKIIVK